jgi:ABC-type transport system involved in cytochrome c biogenesis permease component
MLDKGMARAAIIAFYRKKFGEKVLSAPTTEGFNLLTWMIPFLALFVGGGLIVLMLGSLGFAALATLLAAISSRTRAGDLLLPILAIPLFIPAIIAGVKASEAALSGFPLASASQWLGILIAYDVLFVTLGALLFEHVIRED